MKYSKETYEKGSYFELDLDGQTKKRTQKVVKCRITHSCILCNRTIEKDEYALNERAVVVGQGWGGCYICIKCCEDWLEATEQVEGTK